MLLYLLLARRFFIGGYAEKNQTELSQILAGEVYGIAYLEGRGDFRADLVLQQALSGQGPNQSWHWRVNAV